MTSDDCGRKERTAGIDDSMQPERAAPRPWADYSPIFKRLWPRLQALAGDVAEFGVYQGGTTLQLAGLTGRRVWAFDTFRGTPAMEYSPGLDQDEPGKFNPGPGAVARLLAASPLIVPVAGRFVYTLLQVPHAVRLVLVYLDCDLYQSMRRVLEWLPTHLVGGAAIVVDDYTTHPGVRKAVDKFMANWPRQARFDPEARWPGEVILWT
ncbi:MAG TPA: TylF/MycF/NovP-related O-methyltransferase [Streptosporangiaceae bacterium]